VTEARLLGADVTDGSHRVLLRRLDCFARAPAQSRRGNRTRVSDRTSTTRIEEEPLMCQPPRKP
jgi:hypothetical protein